MVASGQRCWYIIITVCNQCDNDFRSETGLKIHGSKAQKFLRNDRDGVGIGSGQRLPTNAVSSLLVGNLSSSSSSLCMLTVCYYHVSVLPLNRYFGRMANHHRELRTPINVSARCALCMAQKTVVFWEPPIVRHDHCSQSLKHYESMPFHTNENQLTIGGGLQLEKEVSGKSACMHQNEKQAYHEIPRKTASLFHGCCRPNQPRFQNMFSFLFCMFCCA